MLSLVAFSAAVSGLGTGAWKLHHLECYQPGRPCFKVIFMVSLHNTYLGRGGCEARKPEIFRRWRCCDISKERARRRSGLHQWWCISRFYRKTELFNAKYWLLNIIFCLCFRGGEPGCSGITGLSGRSAQGQHQQVVVLCCAPGVLVGPVQAERPSALSPGWLCLGFLPSGADVDIQKRW